MSKKTSAGVAALASKVLTNSNSSATAKQLAGSALSQVNKGNQTGSKMEDVAAKVLDSPKYSDTTKTLAGSVLSQSIKDR
jgi:hypothetical protein